MTRTLDLTPTWAGIMPALVAMIESGKGDGPAIAKEELFRLARGLDSSNAAAKAAPIDTAEFNAGLIDSAHKAAFQNKAAAARDLDGAARDFMTGGAYIRAACYWEAAARIAPPDMEEARDFRVSADLAEREAAALLSRSFDLARKEERADIAENLAAAGYFAAAIHACPYSIHVPAWCEGRASAALPPSILKGL